MEEENLGLRSMVRGAVYRPLTAAQRIALLQGQIEGLREERQALTQIIEAQAAEIERLGVRRS